jgi:hypothetical protein
MTNYERIKQMRVEEMAEWFENYSTNIIVTLANQIIDGCKPEKTSSIEFKKFLLSEVKYD